LIIKLLEDFKSTHGDYPTTAQGLAVLQGVAATLNPPVTVLPTIDPWGNAYVYRSPGSYADFELVSYGADGKPGGEDENADITSWAEASLIGRWYEYTPTSALDISIDTVLTELA
jgi:type II secretion system protein G